MTCIMDRMEFPNEQAAAYYLSAMVDGEGCVDYCPMPGKDYTQAMRRRVRISNTSPSIIAACESACYMLGLQFTKHRQDGAGKKPAWIINLPGTQYERMAALLHLADDGKRDRLARGAKYTNTVIRDPLTGRFTHEVEATV